MSLVSIIKQIQAAANTGADVAHLEQELQQILSTGKSVAADISGDIKTVQALVDEAKTHSLASADALKAVTDVAGSFKADIAELLALVPVLKELAAKAPEILRLLQPGGIPQSSIAAPAEPTK